MFKVIPPPNLRLAFKWIRNVMDSDPIATYEMQIRCIATYQQQLEDLLQFSSWPKTSTKKSAKGGASKKTASSKEKVQKKSKSQSKSALPMIRQGPLNMRQFGRRMGSLSIVGTGTAALYAQTFRDCVLSSLTH